MDRRDPPTAELLTAELLTAALGAAVLSGCTSGGARPAPSLSSSPSTTALEDPDIPALVEWSGAERALAFRYAALVKGVPALAPLRANHLARADAVEEHLSRLGRIPSPGAVLNPALKLPALAAALAKDERAYAALVLARLPRLRDPDVAALGAELAAGARQHAVLLGLVPIR